MSFSSIIISWPAYLLLEIIVRYLGFIRSTETDQRQGKPASVSLFCVLSPGWSMAYFFKEMIRDVDGYNVKEARGKFIVFNNSGNLLVSAILFSVPIAIHLQCQKVPEVVIGFLFWRFLSRSLEISRAFVDDILDTKNESGIDQGVRIKLALKSYAEIYIYSAALYSVLSPCLSSFEEATLGSLYVGTLTNITYVTENIEIKHLVFVQVFTTLSLIVLSIAGYLSNAKK
ncbi:MAG: hypothetical protein U1D97_01670 [Desulfuromonadales bacterium]|nr:hypothetical protein [Desulfuromonadales bacterium]